MKEQLIKDLEALMGEKDNDKIQKLKKSITINTDTLESGLSQAIMQRINIYTDTPNEQSEEGMKNIIERIRNS